MRKGFRTDRRLRALTLAVALVVLARPGQADQDRVLGVTEALDLYSRGKYQEVLDSIGRPNVLDGSFFKTFERDAGRWLKEPTDQPRRVLIGASLALEIAHVLRGRTADQPAEYLVWSSKLMRSHTTSKASAVERLWYLASIATMQETSQPWELAAGVSVNNAVLRRFQQSLPPGGQLEVASSRFPDEPRFLLGRVAARHRFRMPDVTFRPSALDFVRAAAKKAPVRRPSGDRGETAVHTQATVIMQERERIPAAIQAFKALETYPSLRAEIALRVGYLEAGQLNWRAALDAFRRVPELTVESDLQYLSLYFTGRVLQAMADQAKAVEAFEAALRIIPHARSASTLLAVEFLMGGNVANLARADQLLRNASSDMAPEDPWRLFNRGDARLWSTYMGHLREALR